MKWLDGVFTDAGTKWRIAFFHHPLYSSGQHAAESRDVIRPALEPPLVRNHVNVVFSGHEHLYERIDAAARHPLFRRRAAAAGICTTCAPSAFDEVAVSEHHFMVVEIAGDRLFFEAVTPHAASARLRCAVAHRTGGGEAGFGHHEVERRLPGGHDATSARGHRTDRRNVALTGAGYCYA